MSKQTTDNGPDFNQDGEPRLRLDIQRDLCTVRIDRSDWRQPAYAQWTKDEDGRDVLCIEPLSMGQIVALQDAIGLARQRFHVYAVDRARTAAAGGGR